MSTLQAPLPNESETVEADASYDAWLNAKIARSMADARPRIQQEEVERRMAERIAALHARQTIS